MKGFFKKYYMSIIASLLIIPTIAFSIIRVVKDNNNNLRANYEIQCVEFVSTSFNYTGIIDYVDEVQAQMIDTEKEIYLANAFLTIPIAYLLGYSNTDTLQETVDITSTNNIDVLEGTMEIIINISSNTYQEEIESFALYDFDEMGNIIGTINIQGEDYDINDLLSSIAATDGEEDCFFLSFTAICIIAGIIIGGTVGAIGGWHIAKAKKVQSGDTWKYVLGGLVIGAVIGGLIGWGVGQTAVVLFPKLAEIGITIGGGTGALYKNVSKNLVSFTNYNKFLNFFGNAKNYISKGNWHHIVEQCMFRNGLFSGSQIYNSGNTVAISERLHQAITAFFNSAGAKYGYYGYATVRDYVASLSYAEQFKFGYLKLIELAQKLGENIVWIFK